MIFFKISKRPSKDFLGSKWFSKKPFIFGRPTKGFPYPEELQMAFPIQNNFKGYSIPRRLCTENPKRIFYTHRSFKGFY